MKLLSLSILHIKRMIKSKKIFIATLIIPTIIVCIVVFFTEGQSASATDIDVVNYDKGSCGAELINYLSSANINLVSSTRSSAEKRVKLNNTGAAIIIPDDFSQKINSGELPKVSILKLTSADTDMSITNNIYSFISKKLIQQVVSSSIGKTINIDEKNNITTNVEEVKANEYLPLSSSYSLNLIISFTMYSMIYIVNELISLKKNRTIKRSLSTPQSPKLIFGSVLLSFLIIGYIQIIILIGTTRLLFQVNWGNSLLGLFLLFTGLLLVINSMGLLLIRFIKNDYMAPLIVNMVVTITCMMSGSFMPINLMPKTLQKLSVIFPQSWALNGISDIILKNKGALAVLPNFLILILFALVFFTASISSYKKLAGD